MNELIHKKSWWKHSWIWIVTPMILMLVSIAAVISSYSLADPIADFTKAMIEPSIYKGAFTTASKDERVVTILGQLESISVFEVLEGEVRYSEDNNSVMMTVGIRGSKKRGKMDIVADRKGKLWEYQKIRVRVKKPKVIIDVLDIAIE